MKIKLEQLVNAMNYIQPMVITQGNVLLHIENDVMSVRYNDNRTSIAINIDIDDNTDNSDNSGGSDYVLNYKELTDTLLKCKSGQLKTNDIEIVFNGDNTCNIGCIKYTETQDGDEVVLTPVSKVDEQLGWLDPTSNRRYEILNRVDYTNLFNGGGENWEVENLKEVLTNLTIDKSKSVSISATTKKAFVSTLTFASVLDVSNEFTNSLVFGYKDAKAIINILNKLVTSEVNVLVTGEGKFITITDGSTVGLTIERGNLTKTEVNSISEYYKFDYTDYQLKFNRVALEDTINIIYNYDKANQNTLKFIDNADGDLCMLITSNRNEYTVLVSGNVNDRDAIKGLEVPISVKTIKDMLSLCKGHYITMYFSRTANNRLALRIGDIDLERTTGKDSLVHRVETYTTC